MSGYILSQHIFRIHHSIFLEYTLWQYILSNIFLQEITLLDIFCITYFCLSRPILCHEISFSRNYHLYGWPVWFNHVASFMDTLEVLLWLPSQYWVPIRFLGVAVPDRFRSSLNYSPLSASAGTRISRSPRSAARWCSQCRLFVSQAMHNCTFVVLGPSVWNGLPFELHHLHSSYIQYSPKTGLIDSVRVETREHLEFHTRSPTQLAALLYVNLSSDMHAGLLNGLANVSGNPVYWNQLSPPFIL